MLSVFGFLLILAPLVVVHELGHFFFAKVFKVKAEVFSVGFGPRVWSKQVGETNVRISAIPLGGYVKLLGEDPNQPLSEADKKRALHSQAPWKRFWIFFGGPLFNFLFAILVFMVILLIGEPQVANVVGRVLKGSEAAKLGFVSGDRVLSVANTPIKKFTDLLMVIHDHPDQKIIFEIERAKQRRTLEVQTSSEDGFSVYGESQKVGKIDGLLPIAMSTKIAVTHPNSGAAIAGLKTGEHITAIQAIEVSNWEDLESAYARQPSGPIAFSVEKTKNVSLLKPLRSRGLGADLGIYSTELIVEKTMADSPAQKAGIAPGDRITAVSGQEIQSFFGLREAIQSAGEKHGKVRVSWERAGKTLHAEIVPTVTKERDPLLNKVSQFTIGIVPQVETVDPETVVERTFNPFVLVAKATERMLTFSWRNFVSIGKMVTGDVSVATLGGPILIGKIAGDSLERGLIAFLTTMAILSVGLGVLNILPVPVLDGGHLLLLGVEWVRRRPLSLRQAEVIQQVGLSLILLLMVVVLRNDLARLSIFN